MPGAGALYSPSNIPTQPVGVLERGPGRGVGPSTSLRRVDWKSLSDHDRQLLRHRWLKEQLRRCEGEDERNYVRTMAAHMQGLGEWYLGREERSKLLPPSISRRGRPNSSGHMSLMTMDKVEERLRKRGVLDPKPAGRTNGKLLATNGKLQFRSRGILVVRGLGNVVLRVLAWFSFHFGREFRRSKSRSLRSGGSGYKEGQKGCLTCHRCDGQHYFYCTGGPMYPLEATPLNDREAGRLIAEWEGSRQPSKFASPRLLGRVPATILGRLRRWFGRPKPPLTACAQLSTSPDQAAVSAMAEVLPAATVGAAEGEPVQDPGHPTRTRIDYGLWVEVAA